MVEVALIVASVALFLALAAFVIAVIVQVTKASSSGIPKTVATENGFMGTINNGTLTIQTDVNGLLKGQNNAILSATAEDVTKQLITGYDPNPGSISAEDSILSSINKLSGNSELVKITSATSTQHLAVAGDGSPSQDILCTTVTVGSIAIVCVEQFVITNSGNNTLLNFNLPIPTTMFGTQNNIPCVITFVRQNTNNGEPTTVPLTATLTSTTNVQMQSTSNTPVGTFFGSFTFYYTI